MWIAILAFLGLCFGSFVNALIWRLHEQETKPKQKKLSILSGRSICPDCKHELGPADLIPLFSWLWLRGRCRYCKKPISRQYPLVEVSLAMVFVLSYIFWPGDLVASGQKLLFATWLASSVGLMALLVYDIRWMLLPTRMIYPTFAIAIGGRLAYILFFVHFSVGHKLILLGLSILVSSGIFFLLHEASRGRWIGFGDVRLGLILGALLASPVKSFLMIYLAAMLGTLYILPSFIRRQKGLNAKLPFGPFLIAATWITVLFGQSIIDWYSRFAG
jgi:leader peptidase (prepilin peptidase)/N-methyltransferase